VQLPAFTAAFSSISSDAPDAKGEVTVFVSSTGYHVIGSATGLEADITSDDVSSEKATGVIIFDADKCDKLTGEEEYIQGGKTFTPWQDAVYTPTDSKGASSFGFYAPGTVTALAGKVIVLHGVYASTVACGILKEDTSVQGADLTQLASSGVAGETTMIVTATKIIGAGEATGLEKNLLDDSHLLADLVTPGSDCTAKNGCGVHVHSGSGCDAEDQGGHYMKEGGTDPWTTIRYTKTSDAGAATFTFSVTSAERLITAKPFIVHDDNGTRVSCGLIEAPKRSALISGCSEMHLFSLMTVLFAGMFLMSAEL